MAEYSLIRPVGFYFKVEFPDLTNGDDEIFFQEVGGITMELETEAVNNGVENSFTQLLPTRTKYPNLSLKRSLKVSSSLVDWCKGTIQNFNKKPFVEPRTVLVKLLNDKGEPLVTYNFVNAYPVKWAITDFNAQESKIVIETLDLYYQYFTTL